MYWLILLGALGQTPDASKIRTIAEVREALNRFDEMDKVVLQAKAKVEAEAARSLPNKERRSKVQDRLKGFSALELNVSPPYQDAESAMIENVVDDACKLYDVATPIRQWYDTSHGRVWGWHDPSTGYIHYYQQEQPNCSTGRCYGR